MENDSNLIPFSERTEDEQRQIATMGGKASGEARRLKKTFKLALRELLEEEVIKDGKPTGKTYQDLVNLGLLKGAMKGNAYNYRTMLETIGELEPSKTELTLPKLQIEVVDNSNLEEVMYEDNKD